MADGLSAGDLEHGERAPRQTESLGAQHDQPELSGKLVDARLNAGGILREQMIDNKTAERGHAGGSPAVGWRRAGLLCIRACILRALRTLLCAPALVAASRPDLRRDRSLTKRRLCRRWLARRRHERRRIVRTRRIGGELDLINSATAPTTIAPMRYCPRCELSEGGEYGVPGMVGGGGGSAVFWERPSRRPVVRTTAAASSKRMNVALTMSRLRPRSQTQSRLAARQPHPLLPT